MKKLILTILCVSNIVFGLEIPSNHIVSTDWLEKNISNQNIVLIDTRTPKEYENGHLPNAINYPKKLWFQGKIGNVPKLYNTPQQIEKMLSTAGVQDTSIIVFYSAGRNNQDFSDAASAFWNVWIYGIQNTVILNGGYSKWITEQKMTTKNKTQIVESEFEIETFDNSSLASLNDIVEAQYNDDIQIADARVAKFYRGEDDRKDLARHGRVPTAKLTPAIRFTKKVESHFEFLEKEEASRTLNNSDYGLELDKQAIVYCNTGHKARGLWFVSKFVVGMENVKVYDGSIVEYSKTYLPMDDGESMD